MALDGDARSRLEALKRMREKKLGKYSNMIEDLVRKREQNLLAVMESYKWIHHVPQVVFNGVPYSSLVEWAAMKRKELMEAVNRGKNMGTSEEVEDWRFLDALHLEGKAFEELKRKENEKRQYFGGGGVFFVTTDILRHVGGMGGGGMSVGGRSFRKSLGDDVSSYGWGDDSSLGTQTVGGGGGGGGGNWGESASVVSSGTGITGLKKNTGATSGPLVRYRTAQDEDKQPYGPWGRHPQLRYPYASPAEPGDGDVSVQGTMDSGMREREEGRDPSMMKPSDRFHWSKSFQKARGGGGSNIPVKRIQHTWTAKKKAGTSTEVKLPNIVKKATTGTKKWDKAGTQAQNKDPFAGMSGSRVGSRVGSRTGDVGAWSRPNTEGERKEGGGELWVGGGQEIEGKVRVGNMGAVKGGGLSLR